MNHCNSVAVDGRDNLQILWIAAYILNKQCETPNTDWSSKVWLGMAKNLLPQELAFYKMLHRISDFNSFESSEYANKSLVTKLSHELVSYRTLIVIGNRLISSIIRLLTETDNNVIPGNQSTSALSKVSFVTGSFRLCRRAFRGWGNDLNLAMLITASVALGPEILITATPHLPYPEKLNSIAYV